MKTCQICGKELVNKWQKKYCSIDCSSEGRTKTQPLYTCGNCGDKFRRGRGGYRIGEEPKYCSRKCVVEVMAKAREKEKISTTRICEYCKKEDTFTDKPNVINYRKKQRFCSVSCSNKSRYDEEWKRKNGSD